MRLQPTISSIQLAVAAVALLLWLALLLPSLERTRLQDVDELWHAMPAQNAVLHGQWWPLRLDGRPFFEKPPLMPWLAAVAAAASGQPRASWPYRLGNTLSGALVLACLIALGWRAGSFRGGLWAAALLGLQGDFIFHCRFFSMDTPFLGLGLLAVLGMAWALSPGGRPWGWTLAGVGLGLAFWCKSWFVLALLPALGLALWNVLPPGQRAAAVWRLAWPLALAITAWLALYTSWSGWPFLRQEWQGNVAGRVLAQAQGSLRAQIFYYLDWSQRSSPAMLVLALGVTLGLRPRPEAEPSRRFVRLFAWSLAGTWMVGLLMVGVPTINYLLPLEVAVALTLGLGLTEMAPGPAQAWLAALLLVAAFAMQGLASPWVFVAVGAVMGLALSWSRGRPSIPAGRRWPLAAAALLLLALQIPDAVGLCLRPLDAHRKLAALLMARPPLRPGEVLWAAGVPTRAVDFYSSYQVVHVDDLGQAKPGQARLYHTADNAWHLIPAADDPRPALKAL